jgi:hypothetical protein
MTRKSGFTPHGGRCPLRDWPEKGAGAAGCCRAGAMDEQLGRVAHLETARHCEPFAISFDSNENELQ